MIHRQKFPLLLVLLAIDIASGYDWTCNLYCYNNGVCRHGHGKFGSYTGEDSAQSDLPFEEEFHDDGMYCTCPEGYTGLQCEIKYVTCGRDNHTCFNGSTCVKERSSDNGNVFYRCECDIEGSVMTASYAENYCQQIATIFCDGGDGFTHGTSYCTNGGRCKSRDPLDDPLDTIHQVGCECPNGWEGSHCEKRVAFKVPSATEDIVHEIEDFVSGANIVGIFAGATVAIALVLFFRKYGFQRSQRGRGTTNRRRGRKQEMRSYSDAHTDNTRDII